jgi:hypothetical protein
MAWRIFSTLVGTAGMAIGLVTGELDYAIIGLILLMWTDLDRREEVRDDGNRGYRGSHDC